MKSLNRVFIMGYLGHDPELQRSKTGKPYTRLRLATQRYIRATEDNPPSEKSDWHSVFVWGQDAERCAEYLRIGAFVHVEGSLSYWKVAADAMGPGAENGYKNAIHADQIRFITYGRERETPSLVENLDNPPGPRNHNAVAHPVM